jgi:hypothetical protein
MESAAASRNGANWPGKSLPVYRDGLYQALQKCSEMLFLTAAAIPYSDVAVDEFIPLGLCLPNLFTVAAVDQPANQLLSPVSAKASISYANGFEIESTIPRRRCPGFFRHIDGCAPSDQFWLPNCWPSTGPDHRRFAFPDPYRAAIRKMAARCRLSTLPNRTAC